MALRRSIASGVRSLFRKERVEGELDEELRGFLEMAAEEKMKQGMSRKDALRAVRLERDSVETAKQDVHAAGWESFVETCWQDWRFAVRSLARTPGFTAPVRNDAPADLRRYPCPQAEAWRLPQSGPGSGVRENASERRSS